MAKANGSPLGQWSGRVGGQVYAVLNGEQIVRTWQPKVANPKTSLQLMQRAKLALAGKLSHITPDECIIGMSVRTSERRNEFSRNIIDKATVTETNGVFTAVLAEDELKFAKGRVFAGVTAAIGTATTGQVTVTPTFGDTVDGVMIVAVQYSEAAGEYIYVGYAVSDTSGKAVTITLASSLPADRTNVYMIPLVARGSAGKVTTDGVGATNRDYTATLSVSRLDSYEFGESIFVGTSKPE